MRYITALTILTSVGQKTNSLKAELPCIFLPKTGWGSCAS